MCWNVHLVEVPSVLYAGVVRWAGGFSRIHPDGVEAEGVKSLLEVLC